MAKGQQATFCGRGEKRLPNCLEGPRRALEGGRQEEGRREMEGAPWGREESAPCRAQSVSKGWELQPDPGAGADLSQKSFCNTVLIDLPQLSDKGTTGSPGFPAGKRWLRTYPLSSPIFPAWMRRGCRGWKTFFIFKTWTIN